MSDFGEGAEAGAGLPSRSSQGHEIGESIYDESVYLEIIQGMSEILDVTWSGLNSNGSYNNLIMRGGAYHLKIQTRG